MTATLPAQINLYDPSLVPTPERWTARNTLMMVLATLVSLALWGAFAGLLKARLAAEAAQLAPQVAEAKSTMLRLAGEISKLKPDEELQRTLDKSRAVYGARADVLAVLKKALSPDAVTPADILRGFSRQSVPGLWLTGFVVNADTGVFDISGGTNDPAQIPIYVERLGAEKAFAGRTFAALDIVHRTHAIAPSVTPEPATNAASNNIVALVQRIPELNGVIPAVPPVAPPEARPASDASPPLLKRTFHEFKLNSVAGGADGEYRIRAVEGVKP